MEEESLYADLLAALPFPLIVLDGRDRFVWLNPLGEDFFQLSLPVIKDLALDQLIDADSHVFSLIRHARHSGHAVAENALRFFWSQIAHFCACACSDCPFYIQISILFTDGYAQKDACRSSRPPESIQGGGFIFGWHDRFIGA